MKKIISKITVLFICLLCLAACSHNQQKPSENTAKSIDSELKTPPKDILVTEGDINKKYTILGQVEYLPKEGKSIYANNSEASKQIKEMLKKVAYSKYGDKVDAIINARVHQSMKGGFWGSVGAAYGAHTMKFEGEGLAVSFNESATTTETPKKEETQNTVPKKRKSHRR